MTRKIKLLSTRTTEDASVDTELCLHIIYIVENKNDNDFVRILFWGKSPAACILSQL